MGPALNKLGCTDQGRIRDPLMEIASVLHIVDAFCNDVTLVSEVLEVGFLFSRKTLCGTIPENIGDLLRDLLWFLIR